MNNYFKTYLGIIIFSFLSLTQCEDKLRLEEGDIIIFEYEYENFAWGHQHIHWIIDNDGYVRTEIDDPAYLGPPIREMFDGFIITSDTISKEDIEYYQKLVPDAIKGDFESNPGNRADFGAVVFNVYVKKSDEDSYHKYLLSLQSDVLDSINTHRDAEKIVQWMQELNPNLP